MCPGGRIEVGVGRIKGIIKKLPRNHCEVRYINNIIDVKKQHCSCLLMWLQKRHCKDCVNMLNNFICENLITVVYILMIFEQYLRRQCGHLINSGQHVRLTVWWFQVQVLL